jgi:hypothetical protein
LCVISNGYTESYKRFYFRDIQAILIRKTEGHKYGSLILATVAGFFVLCGALVTEPVGKYILFSIAGAFALSAAVYTLLGPTVSCHLRTAVQVEPLPSIKRLRKAHAILKRLQPMISSAQGEMPPEEIAVRFQELLQQSSRNATGQTAGAPPYISSADLAAGDPNVPPRIT